jgi:asparagine synthase (glutamine-hydrolysing)
LAIWSEAERRLVLARDRLGIKPLYICRRGEDIHFGSEVKAISSNPSIERRIDARALSYFLSLNYIPHPCTLLAGVEKLRPGSWLEWRDGRVRTETYWELRFTPREWRLEDAKAELDFLLSRSVNEHLLSDVPLGVWLSGGVDSSAITHFAAQRLSGKVKTFSISFPGRSFDESRFFREVSRAYGTDHHEFDLEPELDIPSAVERMSYFTDEPSADAGALPVYFLSEMTRRHVTVALSGEGADELFGGYYTYLADRYARWMRWIPAPVRAAGLAAACRLLPASDDKIGFEYKVKRFLEGSLLPQIEAHMFWNGACSPRQKLDLLRFEADANPAELFGGLPRDVGGINRFLFLDQLLYLPEDILNKCDRMSMAHSVEIRPPFLDHRIVEFAATLPERFKVNGSKLKFILKELMRERLPKSVLARKKEGFDIPAHDWFRSRLRPMLEDTVTRKSVESTGLFHWPAVERLMADHFARRINAGYQLWGLLTLFLWIERWGVQPARMPDTSEAFFTN